jgi:hypothetical protein
MNQGTIRYLNDEKRIIYLLLLHAENEITEHSQQVGRLYGKVRKGCKAGSLKVHKIEIFFGFDFEICNISLLVMSKY